MRLLRIKLENWRGVEAAEIQLDAGITIIEGDNEAGKSSFIEALNLLFRERDSTKKQELKRVTPKGVDAGSTVEVELTTGAYHLTYSKTFNKKTATTLLIHKPDTLQLVGVQAHDRALQILDETIDFSLWQAIQLEQGGEFSQVSFKHSDSLAQALDNAAGGTGAGDGESVLLSKAQKEYLKYFTEKAGKETGELATLREQQINLEQSGAHIGGSLAELERYIDDSTHVSKELLVMEERLPAMQISVANLEKQRAEKASLQQQVNATGESVKASELRCNELIRQLSERRELQKESDNLKAAIAAGKKNQSELEQVYQKALESLEQATKKRDVLLKQRQSLEQLVRSADVCIELRDQNLKLNTLEQQHRQLLASQSELSELQSELMSCLVDDVTINRIEKLEQHRRDLEMQIGVNSAGIRFKFLKDTTVSHNETQQSYSAGDELTTDSSSKSTIKLDDSLQIDITPASDNYELTLEYKKAVTDLNELLSDCRVKSIVEARAIHRKRAEIITRQREMNKSLKAIAGKNTPDTLANSIETLRQSIVVLKSKSAESDDDSNLEVVRQQRWQQLEELDHSIEVARELRDRSQQHSADSKTRLDICIQGISLDSKSLESLGAKIKAHEAELPIEKLESQKVNAAESLKNAQSKLSDAKAELEKSNSAGVDLLVDNARQSLQRAQSELRDLELQQADIKARLDQMQAEGLHEKHQSVLAAHDENNSQLKQLLRRARAAEKLWKTLTRHQREAQLSYARPLAERVAAMGKVVFGDDFSVELSETLNIVSRTLKGKTVPFDDLSGGAREQLGILLRLAAAQLVSGNESIPLILDDTLGHTDARRLETMGAILNSAAQSTQIVVMTCYPARYSYVGNARVVRLRQQQGSLFETI